MTRRPARARTGPNDSTLPVVCQELPRTATSLRRSRREVAHLRGPRWPQMATRPTMASATMEVAAISGDRPRRAVHPDGPRCPQRRVTAGRFGLRTHPQAASRRPPCAGPHGRLACALLALSGPRARRTWFRTPRSRSRRAAASPRSSSPTPPNSRRRSQPPSAISPPRSVRAPARLPRLRQSEWDHHEQRHGRRDRSSGPRKPSGLPRNGHGWRRTFTACSPCSQRWPSSWQYRALMASGAGKPTRDLGHV